MSDPICLLDELGDSGYEASVVTTYSVHLPFYENVVLPKLRVAGCRQNVVLVDAGQCEAALRDPSTRPTCAGREYALFPIRPGAGRGAFHPKLLFLAGPKRAKLFVGSHNLTVTGFTSNRELTNCFVAEPKGPAPQLEAARQGWHLIRSWASTLSPDASRFVETAQKGIAWLSEPTGASSEVKVLGAGFMGPALWDLVQELIKRRVRRVLAVGAFFDESLAFLQTVHQQLRPAHFVVGIDPSSVGINPKAAAALAGVRFVDASALTVKRGYLHAKAIGFELDNGDEIFVSGSANPSAPAWLAPKNARNVEAVVVRIVRRSESLLDTLGLAGLFELDRLEQAAWTTIAERRRDQPESDRTRGVAPVLAYLAGGGFSIPVEALPESAVKEVEILGSVTGPTVLRRSFPAVNKSVQIALPKGMPSEAVSLLLLRLGSGAEVYAIPYDQAALSAQAQTTTQRALRQAVASLEATVPQLEILLRLVERVVFDGGVVDETAVVSARAARKKAAPPNEEVEQPVSLAVDLDSLPRRHALGRRRVLSENLVVLLDALIYNLGRGLPRPASDTRGTVGPIEEELVGQEDSPEPLAKVDGYALAALCQKKVKTLLLRRLVPHLHLSPEELESQAFRAASQAAAVLSLTKALAGLEKNPPSWLPKWTALVDPESLGLFVWEAAHLLCDPERGVLSAALHDQNVRTAEEVSVVRGLLLWYGWAGRIDLRWATEGEDRDDVAAKLLPLASLLYVLLDTVDDPAARRFARQALAETCEPRRLEPAMAWLKRHLDWGASVKAARAETGGSNRAGQPPRAGDLVVLVSDRRQGPFLVVEAIPGRISVADPWREEGVRKLHPDYVQALSVRAVSTAEAVA